MWCGVARAQSSQAQAREARNAAQQNALAARAAALAAETTFVVVEKSRVYIRIPSPGLPNRRVSQGHVGFYAWQVSVPDPEPFTIVLIADTAMRSADRKDILRASTLRMCPSASPNSLRDCVVRIKARAESYLDGIRLVIDDKAFVARMRRERPRFCSLTAIEPRGRISTIEKTWIYKDRRSK